MQLPTYCKSLERLTFVFQKFRFIIKCLTAVDKYDKCDFVDAMLLGLFW